MPAEDLGVVMDLYGELARRCDDERADRGRVRGCAAAGCVRSAWYSAIRNAAVLPVPVCAWPATSLPASASGSVWAWIGVHCVKPASRMPCITRGLEAQ